MGSFPKIAPFDTYAPMIAGPSVMNGGVTELMSIVGNTISTDCNLSQGVVIYRPFIVEAETYINACSWPVGTSGSTNTVNVEVGIYTEAGVRLTTTGTVNIAAATGANTLKTAALTAVTLEPGAYYLAYVNRDGVVPTGGSNQIAWRGSPAMTLNKFRSMGFFEQNIGSSTALPATATFAVLSSLPTIGVAAIALLGRA